MIIIFNSEKERKIILLAHFIEHRQCTLYTADHHPHVHGQKKKRTGTNTASNARLWLAHHCRPWRRPIGAACAGAGAGGRQPPPPRRSGSGTRRATARGRGGGRGGGARRTRRRRPAGARARRPAALAPRLLPWLSAGGGGRLFSSFASAASASSSSPSLRLLP